jgi:hypothetical protein
MEQGMPPQDLTPAYVCAPLSLLMLWLSLRLRRQQRLLSDLPTSKTQGVFIGLVELAGTAEAEAPLRSYLAEAPCVHYSFQVEEQWSRTVTETYTDQDGKTQPRTRQESGWTDVAHGGDVQDFYLHDDTGVVLIRPEGAKVEPITVFNETVSRSHPLYYAKGPLEAVADSDHRRRFTERAIPLHAPLYVVGQARERRDVVAPEIAWDRNAPLFLISTRSEKSVQRGKAGWSWAWWVLGLLLAGGAGFVLLALHPAALVAAIGAYLLLWAGTWVWMVFNSLIGLRARVRAAWSLVDVELKRRHDLIPPLVSIVSAMSGHETSVQTAVAALRAQLAATPPGVAGPDFAGVAGAIRVVAEKYPAITAQENFAQLHSSLVETEQRIALARGYYNDIATQLATRLERVPDRWVGALVHMQPEALLTATDFERAPVEVQLADTH